MATGQLFVCPHCGDCVEFIEPSGNPQSDPDDFRCDCGAVLEAYNDAPERRYARTVSAMIVNLRGG